MKENHKKTNYPSKNIKTETYEDGDTCVTKHYYDAKDAYVKELIYLKDGIKKVKHLTAKGVASKLEHFVEDKRHGLETKYFISKADGSVKSTKNYDNGKLHGENITYNENGEIIKHEVYAAGKPVLKYLRKDSNSNDITNVQILDKDNVENLPKIDYEKLQSNIEDNPSFVV
jgi:antitoxin component YwqK of YwqJK toxin-antitoxin module